MIQITPHMCIWVAVEPMAFRAGIDGLAAACGKRLAAYTFSGAQSAFGNHTCAAIKVLVYEGEASGSATWGSGLSSEGLHSDLAHRNQPLVSSSGRPQPVGH